MTHTIPTNIDEYNKQYLLNCEITGAGFDVGQVLACPFCCAPGFMTMKPMELALSDDAGQENCTCAECGRSGRNIITREPGETRLEFVQTGGDDPPDWLQPTPRRVEA